MKSRKFTVTIQCEAEWDDVYDAEIKFDADGDLVSFLKSAAANTLHSVAESSPGAMLTIRVKNWK